MHRNSWIWAIAVTALGAAILFLLDLFLDASPWEAFRVPHATTVYFCESTRIGAFIRQPANTYTNLGYLFVAALMFGYTRNAVKRGAGRQAFSRRPPFLYRYPQFGYLYAACLCYTFLGSAFFHASLGLLSEQIDLSAVYATGAVPLAFALHKSLLMRRVRIPLALLLAAFAIWAVTASILAMDMAAHYAFPILLLITAVFIVDIEIRKEKRTSWKWLGPLVSSLIASLVFFSADIHRIGCVPDGLLHPHGLWHLSAAVAAACMFGYMYEAEE